MVLDQTQARRGGEGSSGPFIMRHTPAHARIHSYTHAHTQTLRYLREVLLGLVFVLELARAELPGEGVAPVRDPGLGAVAEAGHVGGHDVEVGHRGRQPRPDEGVADVALL